jgi:hypothetical protein
MARIRTIKPEFWTSEQVVECSPNTRLLFIGMLNFCDDSGIHPANVRRLQMEVFPCGTFNKADVAAMVEELIENQLVEEYEVEGALYWRATGFTKHQKVDQPTYKHPLPDGRVPAKVRRKSASGSPNDEQDSPNAHRVDDERSEGVHPRKGKESNGKESNNPPTPRNRGELNADQRQRFDRFWQEYPNKKSIGHAEKAFAKLNPDDLLTTRMIKALHAQISHRSQLKAAGEFVPEWKHPATWLNAKDWENVLAPVQQQRPLTGTHLSAVRVPGADLPLLNPDDLDD